MLVMIAGVTPTGTFTVASSGGNGLTLWVGASSSGIADKQLSASGSTSTSAMTISGAAANDGITLTLFQLDSDGESVTSKAPGRSRILPFGRMLLLATGQDEQVYVAPTLDDAPSAGQAAGFGTSALMRQLNRAALWRNPGLDEQHLLAVGDDAQIAGQIAGPGTGLLMRAWNRAARPRPMFEEIAFAPPIIDVDIGRPALKYLPRFRQTRAADEQQTLVTPPPDERTVARVTRLRAFRARTQSVDDSRTIVDDDAPRRRVRLTRLRVPAFLAPGAERHPSVLADETVGPPVRRWDRFRRWLRHVAEDFGLITTIRAMLPLRRDARSVAYLRRRDPRLDGGIQCDFKSASDIWRNAGLANSMPLNTYYAFTTADVGKVLGFPLPQSHGTANNFTGCTAALMVRDQNGNLENARSMVFNSVTNEWEYSVLANDFFAGRFWAMVAVTFPGNVTVYSTEVIFDVQAAD